MKKAIFILLVLTTNYINAAESIETLQIESDILYSQSLVDSPCEVMDNAMELNSKIATANVLTEPLEQVKLESLQQKVNSLFQAQASLCNEPNDNM